MNSWNLDQEHYDSKDGREISSGDSAIKADDLHAELKHYLEQIAKAGD